MTTIAAPSFLISLAFAMKASGPSFRLIEFTMHFPCAFFRPARIVSQCEESIIRAAFATAGSLDMHLTNLSISLVLSSMASSMFMSMIVAPSSICFAAICSAWSYSPAAMSLANLREPATLVRSPTFVKLFFLRSTLTASRPLTVRLLSVKLPLFPDSTPVFWLSSVKQPIFPDRTSFFLPSSVKRQLFPDRRCGWRPETALAMAAICSGVVPQHPPTISTSPFCASPTTASAI